MSHLAAALFRHGRIETTLAKAKALRPFSEKIITLAKKAQAAEVSADRIHFRRLAVSQVHDEEAVKQLFTERVSEFVNRKGGYTRIYKLCPRRGDAAKMAIIELIPDSDKGYKKSRRVPKSKKGSAREVQTSSSKESKNNVVALTENAPEAQEDVLPIATDMPVLLDANPSESQKTHHGNIFQ
jgi:large subunit ribosomal protein L17